MAYQRRRRTETRPPCRVQLSVGLSLSSSKMLSSSMDATTSASKITIYKFENEFLEFLFKIVNYLKLLVIFKQRFMQTCSMFIVNSITPASLIKLWHISSTDPKTGKKQLVRYRMSPSEDVTLCDDLDSLAEVREVMHCGGYLAVLVSSDMESRILIINVSIHFHRPVLYFTWMFYNL